MSEETQGIIADVFKDTGVRLSPDDPIVAVLLAQSRFFNKALAEGAAKNELFLNTLQAERQMILDAVAELKEYRTQVLTELVQENKQSVEELTDKVYAGVRHQIESERRHSGPKWFGVDPLFLVLASLLSLAALITVLSRFR